MDLSQLHFARPFWLWALLVIPGVSGLFFFYSFRQQPMHQLEKFIDKHLIPFLLIGSDRKKQQPWMPLFCWSLVWSCFVIALAGPRWDFHEIETFTREQSLVILLDLSESMNAKDVSPSRLGRAKQKIEDLISLSKGVKIGLIAFAADPHMITPLTEDKEALRHLLPSLNTDLVYVQGSKLTPALEMATTMLENEPGASKAIIVISDGGFEDTSALHVAKKLAEQGIVLYTLGLGTLEGTPLKNKQGVMIKKNGVPLVSKLERERFRELSTMGQGRYFEADHSGEEALLFEDLANSSKLQQETRKSQRFWEERFYLFLLPVLPFFLWWYRRGYLFAILLSMLMPSYSHAALTDYFHNAEQQANQAFEAQDYAKAAEVFQDPYKKGVAYYRAGDYAAAEEMFRQASRPEIAPSASYNLGNALAQQNRLKEAIAAYEDVLQKWPDHKAAKENLELLRKMLEQQQEQPQAQQQSQEEPALSKQDSSSQDEKEKPVPRSQEDLDADLWLNQIKNDPKSFLKNKFYLESKQQGTKEEVDPW